MIEIINAGKQAANGGRAQSEARRDSSQTNTTGIFTNR
jgi:hypothetical protein